MIKRPNQLAYKCIRYGFAPVNMDKKCDPIMLKPSLAIEADCIHHVNVLYCNS